MNGRADSGGALRVCVCTSYSAAAEPRAPRHALAIAAMDPRIRVTFVECVPRGAAVEAYDPFAGVGNIQRLTYRYANRGAGKFQLAAEKLARLTYRLLFRLFGFLHPGALNTRFVRFTPFLERIEADVYLGHNVETLLPVCEAAERGGGVAMFDSMEFHSDMGDSQNELDRAIVSRIERRCLPRCALILASSEEMAIALADTYGIPKPLALYNVPPVDPNSHVCDHPGLSLYWRQRGLQDILSALPNLPEDIVLHLQGRLPADGGAELRGKIESLGLTRRVFVHGPYSPPEAVRDASHYCVGLCLEHGEIRNHQLTVSNKMFDYLMGGLVVVASNLPSLRGVIERSGGGVCFEPGNSDDLAARILELRDNRPLRLRLAANARAYAIKTGNREMEMARFQEAFRQVMELRRAHRDSTIDT
jgi:glycosyltransferase involved in cell wall biosynthesis